MTTVTSSIGTTARDYGTVAAWEADADNTGVYSSGDVMLGEMYADSDFDEFVTLNGGATSGISEMILSVADGERHTGIEGTGVRVVSSGVGSLYTLPAAAPEKKAIEWIEMDKNGYKGVYVTCTRSQPVQLSHCIMHGSTDHPSSSGGFVNMGNWTTDGNVHNCIMYDTGQSSMTWTVAGIYLWPYAAGKASHSYNNTIHGVYHDHVSGTIRGVHAATASHSIIRNTVVMETTGNTAVDFLDSSPNASTSNNCSSDTTAPGSDSLTSKTDTDQFEDVGAGTEDFHRLGTADLVEAGIDQGTSPDNVEIDIDGYDRDAGGVTWDIGADQGAVVAATQSTLMLLGVG